LFERYERIIAAYADQNARFDFSGICFRRNRAKTAVKSNDGLDIGTRPCKLQCHRASEAETNGPDTGGVDFGPSRQCVQSTGRSRTRLRGIGVQGIEHLDGHAEILDELCLPVQIAGKRDVTDGSQTLCARESVLIEAISFGVHQYARSRSAIRLEKQLTPHRQSVGLID
jgi:hypothetical protein